ncbi:MAG: hypothetical protein ACK5NK_07765 [Niabella sp.]
MKKLIDLVFISLFCIASSAQDYKPVNQSYQDFEYKKQPVKVERMSYEFKDKLVTDTEKEVLEFDEKGNIKSSVITSFLDNNAQIKITYEYNNGLLVKQRQENSTTPHLQYTITYFYDKKGNSKTKKLKTDDGVTETYTYEYKNGKLVTEKAKFSPKKQTIYTYLYNPFGELYTIEGKENIDGKVAVFYDLYHNNKKVADYDELGASGMNAYLYTETPKSNIEYQVVKKEMLEEIKEMQKRLGEIKHDSEPAMNENLSFLNKNLHYIKPVVAKYFKRNENGDIIAATDVYQPFKTVENIDFYKITYSDGSVSGDKNFDIFTYNELQKLLTDDTL